MLKKKCYAIMFIEKIVYENNREIQYKLNNLYNNSHFLLLYFTLLFNIHTFEIRYFRRLLTKVFYVIHHLRPIRSLRYFKILHALVLHFHLNKTKFVSLVLLVLKIKCLKRLNILRPSSAFGLKSFHVKTESDRNIN